MLAEVFRGRRHTYIVANSKKSFNLGISYRFNHLTVQGRLEFGTYAGRISHRIILSSAPVVAGPTGICNTHAFEFESGNLRLCVATSSAGEGTFCGWSCSQGSCELTGSS